MIGWQFCFSSLLRDSRMKPKEPANESSLLKVSGLTEQLQSWSSTKCSITESASHSGRNDGISSVTFRRFWVVLFSFSFFVSWKMTKLICGGRHWSSSISLLVKLRCSFFVTGRHVMLSLPYETCLFATWSSRRASE